MGHAALQAAKNVYADIERATAPTQGNASPTPDRPGPIGSQRNPVVGNERIPSPESPTCNVGNYTADSGTLHLFAPEINKGTGEIVVTGVDTARPTTPFRFIWGDGTVSVGWFPQRKIYKTRPYTRETNCYQVWVVATHQDGSLAEAARAVSP